MISTHQMQKWIKGFISLDGSDIYLRFLLSVLRICTCGVLKAFRHLHRFFNRC